MEKQYPCSTHPLFGAVLRLRVERDGLDEVAEVAGGLKKYPVSSLVGSILLIGVTIQIIDRCSAYVVNQFLPSLSGVDTVGIVFLQGDPSRY